MADLQNKCVYSKVRMSLTYIGKQFTLHRCNDGNCKRNRNMQIFRIAETLLKMGVPRPTDRSELSSLEVTGEPA